MATPTLINIKDREVKVVTPTHVKLLAKDFAKQRRVGGTSAATEPTIKIITDAAFTFLTRWCGAPR